MADDDKTREMVRDAYGRVAERRQSCCTPVPSCCCGGEAAADQPLQGTDLGLSCGNPLAFAEVRAGDVVLDLGSGAGRDVFIAAKAVGAAGRVIGVDMTPQMLELARSNAGTFTALTGLSNVEFREGVIEALPVEDAGVDLVISNCVINLSPDKARVFREIARVLKGGGRMVVSDIVLNAELPPEVKGDEALYTACLAGALRRDDYLAAIAAAGLAEIEILSEVSFDPRGAAVDPITEPAAGQLAGLAASITVRALKPPA